MLHEFKGQIADVCYETTDASVSAQIIYKKLPQILAVLGEKSYFAGDYITLADLHLLEVIDYAAFITMGEVFEKLPQTKAFHERML
jgi:glutathione S-transferase